MRAEYINMQREYDGHLDAICPSVSPICPASG